MFLLTYQKNILHERVNTMIGTALLCSCALWAIVLISEASWGIDPVAQAFSVAIERETLLP